MKTKSISRILIFSILLIILPTKGYSQELYTETESESIDSSESFGTAFTYQGQLNSSGAPVNDNCDFMFSLWDEAGSGEPPTGGDQVGSTQSEIGIPVSNGLFAVQLDFGDDAFNGEGRWLQTEVRCPTGSGSYTTLAPRQALNPVPYALYSQDVNLPIQKWQNSSNTLFSLRNDGTGGTAYFDIYNPLSNSTALNVKTNGSGNAGRFENSGSGLALAVISSGTALDVKSNGSGNAGRFENSGNGTAVEVISSGTGDAAKFHINNSNSDASVINAYSNGLGVVAAFYNTNPLNTHSVLAVDTNSSGGAARFGNTGSGRAISVESNGSEATITGVNNGMGDVAFLRIENPDNDNDVINASTFGTGTVASFYIENSLNDYPALHASTNGSGDAGKFSTSGSGNGIWGESTGSGYAGFFYATGSGNGVFISVPEGNEGLNVAGGSKNAVVATSKGARLLYTEESSAVWFTDYDFGHLTDGSVFINIDPLFAETVNLDEPYHVFIQVYGDAEIYVSQRTAQGFEVSLRAGDPNVEFSYRLVATRRGFEDDRLEPATWANNDPNLFPGQPTNP